MKVTRTITVTVCLPVSVTMKVATEVDDLAELDDAIWGIASIEGATVPNATNESVIQAMTSAEMEAADAATETDEAKATQTVEISKRPKRARAGKR